MRGRCGNSWLGGLLIALLLAPATAVSAQCVGDCSGDGEVTVDEIITGVNIALGSAAPATCASLDSSADGEVTIDEILQAVNAALVGCPATPTVAPPSATPTATVPPFTPLPTASPTATATFTGPLSGAAALGRNVAGRAAVIANGLAAFPPLVTAIITGLQAADSGAPASTGGGGAVSSCPGGGQVELTCTGVGSVTITMSFVGCRLSTGDGTLTFDTGTVTLRGFGTCPNVVVAAPALDETIDLSTTLRDADGNVELSSVANLTGSVTELGISPGSACFLSGGTVSLNGTIRTQTAGGAGAQVQFHDTSTRFSIGRFSANCTPLQYALTFDGRETVTEPASGEVFEAQLAEFRTAYDSGSGGGQTQLSGQLESSCISASPVQFTTREPLLAAPGSLCFAGGRLDLVANQLPASVTYRADGSLAVDTSGDGSVVETYPSCLDASLLRCSS